MTRPLGMTPVSTDIYYANATSDKDFAFYEDNSSEEVHNDQQAEASSTDSSRGNSPIRLPPPKVSPEKIPLGLRLYDPERDKKTLDPSKNPDIRHLVLKQRFLEMQQQMYHAEAREQNSKGTDALAQSTAAYNYEESLQYLSNSNQYSAQSQEYFNKSNAAAQAAAVFRDRIRDGLDQH